MFNFNIIKNNNLIDENKLWDTIIIGGGPAGLNALLYAKRKGLDAILIAGELGGQLNNTDLIDNYLGLSNISGSELTNNFINHLEPYKKYILLDKEVTNIKEDNEEFFINLKDLSMYKSKTVIFATGGNPKKLGVNGEVTYNSKGISYCTICDAPFFKDKHVIVAGGGNSAAESVSDLLKWASHVTLVHRSQFRADKVLLDKFINDSRVTIHLETQILNILGNEKLTHIEVLNKLTNETYNINADGMFVNVGVVPNTNLLKDLVDLNEKEEVIVDNYQRTSKKGFYAVGDVTNQLYKQIIISAAEGAKAVLDIDRYLTYDYKKGNN